MSYTSIPSLINLFLCLGLGGFVLSRNTRRPAHIGFAMGMAALSVIEASVFMVGFSDDPLQGVFWGKVSIVGQTFLPGSWLLFSLTFARANATSMMRRWRPALAGFYLIPLAFLTLLGSPLFITPLHTTPAFSLGIVGTLSNVLLLVSMVVILMNLEQTFRTSSGMARWRIKYMILGVAAILGLQIYSSGQTLLFSVVRLDSLPLRSASLLVANGMILFSLVRHRLLDVDLFVSRYVLYNSVTLLLSGVYLFVVGFLVFGIQRFGGESYLPLVSIIVFMALMGFMVLALSDGLKRKLKTFINTHFYKNKHDYRIKWREFTAAVGTKLSLAELVPSFTSWLADTLGTTEVSLWLLDQGAEVFREQRLVPGKGAGAVFSAECLVGSEGKGRSIRKDSPLVQFIERHGEALVPEAMAQDKGWLLVAEGSRGLLDTVGASVYVPIRLKGEMIALITLGRKITNNSYDTHDLELLMTIAEQAAGQIERIQLNEALTSAKEMEAFHTLSSFFVHDLKNHTATLSLLAQNVLVHGENPEFRKDAFKTIGETAHKMEKLIQHVSLGSKSLVLTRRELDLNRLIENNLASLNGVGKGQLHTAFGVIPSISVDSDQISTVICNLVINAIDAIDATGEVTIKTGAEKEQVFLSVHDNGCGMSAEFIAKELFKPLHTTKASGWGIGLFQCQQIIKAHGGRITVESEEGRGSTFKVEIPVEKRG